MDAARDAAIGMVCRSLEGALLCCCATVLTTALDEQVDELVQAAAAQLSERYGEMYLLHVYTINVLV